jgi:hypothetical protein
VLRFASLRFGRGLDIDVVPVLSRSEVADPSTRAQALVGALAASASARVEIVLVLHKIVTGRRGLSVEPVDPFIALDRKGPSWLRSLPAAGGTGPHRLLGRDGDALPRPRNVDPPDGPSAVCGLVTISSVDAASQLGRFNVSVIRTLRRFPRDRSGAGRRCSHGRSSRRLESAVGGRQSPMRTNGAQRLRCRNGCRPSPRTRAASYRSSASTAASRSARISAETYFDRCFINGWLPVLTMESR